MYTPIVLILNGILIVVALYQWQNISNMKKKVEDAEAREQGLDEVEEGYQAEIMDLEDRLQNVTTSFHNMNNAALRERMNLRENHAAEVTQYEATIDDLKEQLHNAYESHRLLKEEHEEVRQAALDMQIELTAPESKTPEQIYRETHEALGEYDVITKDTIVNIADDFPVKGPKGEIIGTVDKVESTDEGLMISFTPNDKFPQDCGE